MFNRKKKFDTMSPVRSRAMLGPNLSFSASEAYKLLRTNLEFSLADARKCKIIGVTSSMAGEGKSTTSINIAYTIAQTGKRVLLLEADLRLPTAAQRLGIRPAPGLSNYLVGQCSGDKMIQRSALMGNFFVITAGAIPPNPAELMGSGAMQETMRTLSQMFDVIIVDLPPANVVSDALILSKLIDGVVVVVLKDYCEKKALDTLIRQLRFAGTKILGFVMTGSDLPQSGYTVYKKG